MAADEILCVSERRGASRLCVYLLRKEGREKVSRIFHVGDTEREREREKERDSLGDNIQSRTNEEHAESGE